MDKMVTHRGPIMAPQGDPRGAEVMGPRGRHLSALAATLNGAPPVQRLAASAPPNRTGLPDALKTGVESLSGMSLDHVRVHRNSARPAQLNAHAYAQGSDIHLAPGQERHLPHEAWHVVQQAQGRVRPTMQMKAGVAVNDDAALEQEADVIGGRAMVQGKFGGTHWLTQAAPRPLVADTAYRVTGAGIAQRNGEGKLVGGVGLGTVGALIGTMVNPGLGTLIGGGIGGLIGILGGYIYDSKHDKPPVSWKLYINPKDFAQAERLWNPGSMYDKDKSKGYQASMVKALGEELFGARLGGRVDYDEYVRLHNSVTSSLQSDGVHFTSTLESIRTASSAEDATGFPINDWSDEKLGPAQDLRDESINGLPMVTDYQPKMPLSNEKAIEQNKQPSVTVFDPETNDGQFSVRYSRDDGAQIVTAILDRYYGELEGVKNAKSEEEAEDIKLDAIVKVIRALHVTHPFKDANGRLHVQLMLNRFLLEQGFPLSIMPLDKGLGVFGGAFSIPQLKQMVRAGFQKVPPKPKDKAL